MMKFSMYILTLILSINIYIEISLLL